MIFEKEKLQHNCDRPVPHWSTDGPHSWSSWGAAIRYVLYDPQDAKWYVDNDEYASEISYCPFCGAKLLSNGYAQPRIETHDEA